MISRRPWKFFLCSVLFGFLILFINRPKGSKIGPRLHLANFSETEPPSTEDRQVPILAERIERASIVNNEIITPPSRAGDYVCRHRNSKYAGSQRLPPRLAHVFKRYNRLHDKLLREASVEESVKIPLTSRNNSVRYILLRHQPEGDLATQFYTLLSTFLFALLTDRVMIVDNEDYRAVMCEPFTRSSWFVDRKTFEQLSPASKDTTRVLAVRRPIRALKLDLLRSNIRAEIQCAGNLKEAFSHVQWLIVNDNAGQFINLLLSNTAHDQYLKELFPSGSIIAHLYHAIIHPSNNLWQDIPELLKAYSDSAIERPLKMSVVANDCLGIDTRQAIQNVVSDSVVDSGTTALLLSPSDGDIVNDSLNAFMPPAYLVTCTAAHFHRDSVQDRYGRFFADIFLSMNSDVLLFQGDYTLGWLTHAMRNKPAFMMHMSQIMDIAPVDFPGQPKISCEAHSDR